MNDAILTKIVMDEMRKDGVWPKNPWRLKKNTRDWLEERGFKINYLPGSNNYYSRNDRPAARWELEKEGFWRLSIRQPLRNAPLGVMLIYIPKEMVERIAVFGTIPPLCRTRPDSPLSDG